MSDYPSDRHGVWALDFLKVVHRAGVAKSLGAAGLALISEVALAEHAKDYLVPPDFWNGQLKDACGLSDEDAFNALRTRCTKAGWLVYQRGAYPGAAGLYWVEVPTNLRRLLRSMPVRPVQHPGEHPGKLPGKGPGKHPGEHPGKLPGKGPGKHPGKNPGSSSPSPNPTLPPPPPTKQRQGAGAPGVGGDGGDRWDALATQRTRIERCLDDLQVATGLRATNRWIAALKTCKAVTSTDLAVECLKECIARARAAGENVNYSSDVADRIRRWKPTQATP